MVKENSAIFYHIFCPSGLFAWTCEIFMKVAKPKFSENSSIKFSVEQFVYKNFLDMAEAIFMDHKYFHQILFFFFSIYSVKAAILAAVFLSEHKAKG